MKAKLNRLVLGAVLGVAGLLVGCSDESAAPAANAPAPAATPGATTITMQASDPGVATMVGTKDPARGLVTTGREGYLMFGPYIPLAPGNYEVTIHGTIEAQAGVSATLDVVSDKGATKLGGATVSQPQSAEGAILARIDFTVPVGVTDLEVRASVPANIAMSIASYTITKRP